MVCANHISDDKFIFGMEVNLLINQPVFESNRLIFHFINLHGTG